MFLLLTESLWRNWLARSAFNRDGVGSNPTRDGIIFLKTSLPTPVHGVGFANGEGNSGIGKRG